MDYFINDEERAASGSTCYFEFQKGKHKNKFWLKDSIYIHAALFDKLLLFHLFADSHGNFDYYGPKNIVDKEQWHKIIEKSKDNEYWQLAVDELTPWVEECFENHKYFTILGI